MKSIKMKYQVLFGSLFLAFLFFVNLNANTIQYGYDAAGNRISRTIIMDQSQNAKKTEPEQEPENHPAIDVSLGNTIKIYPNPTQGKLKIEISDFQEEQKASYILFSSGGKTVINNTSFNGAEELDLSSYPSETYILRLIVDGKNSEWKIIKQ